ncbi:forkhead box protein N1 isoform X6 [Bubalus bubalis]|uniref:forkhead box protein N1 isoform X6 n=1 Tax=Bubalus bubalis TaxID=89462 RepID=UPI001D10A9C7|nr:forkhead box protein N1 isoform X6 [Bubalus bubalis]
MALRSGSPHCPHTAPASRHQAPSKSTAQQALARAPSGSHPQTSTPASALRRGLRAVPGASSRAATCLSTHTSDISMRMSSPRPRLPWPSMDTPLRPQGHWKPLRRSLRMWGRLRPSCLASLPRSGATGSPTPARSTAPKSWGQKSRSSPQLWRVVRGCTVTSPPCSTCTVLPSPPSTSILIFMALKNSKTGSLPVSEIYNFMTEHFPYFKTAPDGWKNSVRHNLSLNKCFEKVENKSGSSSRKGCLWALNPAKIDKMQEELQKWKRKDPIAVRKSMAKPEELDSLIGDKREKLGSPLLGCPPPGLAGSGPIQPLAPPAGLSQPLHSIHPAPGPIPGKNPLQDLLGGHAPSCYGQTYSHLSPGLAPPGPPQPLFPQPDGHLELRAQPGTPQDSPLPAHTPPSHSAKLLAEPSPARTMHDTLLPDGDLGTDLDAINPSLTDFDFQGNLWEQLKDDSLALDPLVLVTSSPPSSSVPPAPLPCYPPGPCLAETGSGTGDLAPPGNGGSGALGDLHLTTLYSAFMELEPTPPAAPTGPSVYLSPSSKPMALA